MTEQIIFDAADIVTAGSWSFVAGFVVATLYWMRYVKKLMEKRDSK